jgi:hypothetical protein
VKGANVTNPGPVTVGSAGINIRKNRDVRKAKVTRNAAAFSGVDRSGGPPARKSIMNRIMGRVSNTDFQMLPSVAYTCGLFIL